MFVLYGFVALCSFAGISAETGEGCRDFKPLENFNISQHMGTWYHNGQVNANPWLKCFKFTLFVAPSGKIQTSDVGFEINGPRVHDISGEVRVLDPYNPGQWEIITNRWNSIINRTILGTDYTSYSVHYDCWDRKVGGVLRISTREINPPQSVINEGLRVIREHGITIKKYVKKDQSCWTSGLLWNEEKTTTNTPETAESLENTPDEHPI